MHFQALFVVGVHLGNPLSTCVDGFFVADVKLGVGAQPIVGLLAVAFKHLENRFVVLALHFGVGPDWMILHGHVLGDWIHNRQTNAKVGVLWRVFALQPGAPRPTTVLQLDFSYVPPNCLSTVYVRFFIKTRKIACFVRCPTVFNKWFPILRSRSQF